jgi:Flp pilus assembly secretin CpaC
MSGIARTRALFVSCALLCAEVSLATNAKPTQVSLAPGTTTLVDCPKVEHVALGNAQVVSVQETLPGKLLLSAIAPGATQLWCLSGSKERAFDIVVTGVSPLKPNHYVLDLLVAEVTRAASRSLGAETSVNGSLNLSGEVISSGLNRIGESSQGLATLDLFSRLSLLERQGQAETWSRGELRVQSGARSELLAGGEIPIPGGEQSTEFRPYGLDLVVEAQSVDLNSVSLAIDLSLTALDYGVAIDGVPGLTSRELNTTRQFAVGEAVVLARIERGERGNNDSGLPGVPTQTSQSEEERELWVLIRPRVESAVASVRSEVTPMAGSRGALGVYE